MRQDKKDWIEDQCREMENNMRRNEMRRVYETVKRLMNVLRPPQYCYNFLQLIFGDLWAKHQSVGNGDVSVQNYVIK